MKILHVITTLDVGGAERLMVDLLPLLKKYGDDIDLLLFNGKESLFKKEIESKGVTVYELSCEEGYADHREVNNPLNILRLRNYLRQYDIIHTHNTACQFYVPLASKIFHIKAKLVTTEHSSNNRRRSKRWFKPIDKWMYGQYDAIISIADQAHLNLVNYIGTGFNKMCTIYNGVDTKRFSRPIKDITNQKSFVITMIAGYRNEKDHETVMRAMCLLPDNYRLHFVGRGEKELILKSYSIDLGIDSRVVFMGPRMDVPSVLEESDINVLSSHWEGLSLSSIEGMASGRPFIASNVEGLREVVGGAGVLFPHGDEKALANAIKDLCENPVRYRDVAISCQKRAQNYDISKMAKAYQDLYESLLKP